MQYFLDSAKIDEIQYAAQNWGIDGITTNPRHILASGKPFLKVIREIAQVFEGKEFPISVEINPHLAAARDIVAEAEKFAALSKNFVIKIPCNEQGLVAARELKSRGVKTNVTLVFSAAQALQAGRIRSDFVSPFVGWKETHGEDCTQFIQDIVSIYKRYGFKTQIIVAAMRNGKQIIEAARAGADIVTAGFDVYKDSFHHPFTDMGLSVFTSAWDKTEIGEI